MSILNTTQRRVLRDIEAGRRLYPALWGRAGELREPNGDYVRPVHQRLIDTLVTAGFIEREGHEPYRITEAGRRVCGRKPSRPERTQAAVAAAPSQAGEDGE